MMDLKSNKTLKRMMKISGSWVKRKMIKIRKNLCIILIKLIPKTNTTAIKNKLKMKMDKQNLANIITVINIQITDND